MILVPTKESGFLCVPILLETTMGKRAGSKGSGNLSRTMQRSYNDRTAADRAAAERAGPQLTLREQLRRRKRVGLTGPAPPPTTSHERGEVSSRMKELSCRLGWVGGIPPSWINRDPKVRAEMVRDTDTRRWRRLRTSIDAQRTAGGRASHPPVVAADHAVAAAGLNVAAAAFVPGAAALSAAAAALRAAAAAADEADDTDDEADRKRADRPIKPLATLAAEFIGRRAGQLRLGDAALHGLLTTLPDDAARRNAVAALLHGVSCAVMARPAEAVYKDVDVIMILTQFPALCHPSHAVGHALPRRGTCSTQWRVPPLARHIAY